MCIGGGQGIAGDVRERLRMTDTMTGEAAYPLAGLKVLDFSRVLAGPFAGRMLSDLGADVVKVEPPDGDVTRQWGRVVAGLPGYYLPAERRQAEHLDRPAGRRRARAGARRWSGTPTC